MKINFETYNDEKLINWIRLFELTPMIKYLYDKDGQKLYKKAIKELNVRGLRL